MNTESSRAERALRAVAARSSGGPVDAGLRITLNFHPDRFAGDRPILESMLDDGVYHSQFATGTTNGGATAFPGGDRWQWESRMFAAAYDDAAPHERPVYGALNVRRDPVGAAPRFGSAHFRLTAATLSRATFCFPDSHLEPAAAGVAHRMAAVHAAHDADRGGSEPLNDYIEAQVHGPLRLDTDVEAVVLDPCYRGTPVETRALRFPFPVEWHGGFRLTVDELRRYPNYRGRTYMDAAAAIAGTGVLDPWGIGTAARAGSYDGPTIKKVWHYLACFGSPTEPVVCG
ncbi:DUF3626 domain-containing protein [Rhodococcus phenolicus]|uniref:DUF3626 domain-containing protein n=1 Tax=Rhodococcus phenolicus TaxID=263849 RepID=UPI000837499A|nr:DUF3626 domain-containing protein [Rhodococcus phenolicus]